MADPLRLWTLTRWFKVSPLTCFTTIANPQSGSLEVEIGSTGTEAIRRWHTYPPSYDDVLFAAVHKAGNRRIWLRPGGFPHQTACQSPPPIVKSEGPKRKGPSRILFLLVLRTLVVDRLKRVTFVA
jgi:hypothetical protein